VTIILEVIAGAIALVASYIGFRARQIYHMLTTVKETSGRNNTLLEGVDGSGYDGLVDKVQDHETILGQHERALRREDILAGETYNDDTTIETDDD